MEVKDGYKRTDLGMIPDDWEVRTLDSLCEITASGDLVKEDYSPTDDSRYKYPIYANAATTDGLYGYSKSYQHEANQITVTARGAGVGKAEYRITPFCAIGRLLVLSSKNQCDLKYITEYINNSVEFAIESTGVPQLTAPQIGKYIIALPTLAEQEAIAGALSDADALIESLEQLIAKKRLVKQGAMQELLTGKRRLPGFSGEWEMKRLGDVGEISSAGVDKKIRPDEVQVRLVNYLDVYHKDFIYSDDLSHWVTAPSHQANRCAVKQGDIFFTPTSETRDDIGISAVAMEDIPDATYSYHVVRLRLREEWDLRFRTYIFKTRAFLDQAQRLCDGNGTRYVISQGKFRSMVVHVPPINEQTAIADILSDMDAEIAALEEKLGKARLVKQGMMQELLTGRIRLV